MPISCILQFFNIQLHRICSKSHLEVEDMAYQNNPQFSTKSFLVIIFGVGCCDSTPTSFKKMTNDLDELTYQKNKLWAIKGLEMFQMDNYTTQSEIGENMPHRISKF